MMNSWLVVDGEGNEFIYDSESHRWDLDFYHEWWVGEDDSCCIRLPKGTIKKIIGRDLRWEDDPVKLVV